MDTSKEYVKMCDCPEIQDKIIGEKGKYSHDFYYRKILLKGSVEDFLNNSIWLPRQDQIQEMLDDSLRDGRYSKGDITIDWFVDSWRMCWKPDPLVCYTFKGTSFEQLWLAFYMYEKHKKTWDGKKWQIENK